MTFLISVTEFSKVDRIVNDLRREIVVSTVTRRILKRNGGMANSVVTIPASTVFYNHANANLPLYTHKKKNIDEFADGQLKAKQKISFALK